MENTSIIKRFADWASIKLNIHLYKEPGIKYFKERQVWWVNFGQNIGNEQNGKNDNFERPVLVLKKFNNTMFLALPMSSKIKIDQYCLNIKHQEQTITVNFSQIRVLSSNRLLRKTGSLNAADFENLKLFFIGILQNGRG